MVAALKKAPMCNSDGNGIKKGKNRSESASRKREDMLISEKGPSMPDKEEGHRKKKKQHGRGPVVAEEAVRADRRKKGRRWKKGSFIVKEKGRRRSLSCQGKACTLP